MTTPLRIEILKPGSTSVQIPVKPTIAVVGWRIGHWWAIFPLQVDRATPVSSRSLNVTSSTIPEAHNVSQRATTTQKIWWTSAVWFSTYASGQTDRQTDKYTYPSQYSALLPGAKWITLWGITDYKTSVKVISLETNDNNKDIDHENQREVTIFVVAQAACRHQDCSLHVGL